MTMDKFTQLRLARASAYELAEHITAAIDRRIGQPSEIAVEDAEQELARIAMLMGFDIVRPTQQAAE